MAQAVTTPLSQNVLRDGLILPRTPDPAAMVIFGASGDLTARKLMPALYNLALNRYLPSGFSVIGVADTAISEDEFRSRVADAVQKFSRTQPVDRAVWQSLAEGISYVRMPFDDEDGYGSTSRPRPSSSPSSSTGSARRASPRPARAGNASSSRSRLATT